MAQTYQGLSEMTDAALVHVFDASRTPTTEVVLTFIRQELALRAQARQTDQMLRLTRQIRWMTAIVTVATIVNVAIACL